MSLNVEMQHIVCPRCGLVFSVPTAFQRYQCPGIHCANPYRDANEHATRARLAEMRISNLKGQITRLKNKAKADHA